MMVDREGSSWDHRSKKRVQLEFLSRCGSLSVSVEFDLFPG